MWVLGFHSWNQLLPLRAEVGPNFSAFALKVLSNDDIVLCLVFAPDMEYSSLVVSPATQVSLICEDCHTEQFLIHRLSVFFLIFEKILKISYKIVLTPMGLNGPMYMFSSVASLAPL